jgi:hypothetical protein
MMRRTLVFLVLAGCSIGVDAQQRRSGGGLATLAITVTDPSGTPLSGVKVIVEGASSRQTRTERGRIAIEDLPSGSYKLRFELEGFTPLERELTARAGKPIDVKVTLTPAPKPEAPPAPPPPAPRPATLKVDSFSIDIPAFLDKNFVGRSAGKSSPLTCATGGTALLLQVREPLAEHSHDDADEFAYVVAGEGTGRVGGTEHRLQAGVLVMVPRGMAHSFTARGRNPLILMSVNAGQACPN